MASKYTPPHIRAAAAAGAGPTSEPTPPTQSHAEWLREQQSRYQPVAKTAEQIRAEVAAMTFQQLKTRAGPPPTINSEDFGGVWEQGGEGEGARVCIRFDDDLRYFKLGRCPPPEPLGFTGRDETIVNAAAAMDGVRGAMDGVKSASSIARSAYTSWYRAWGAKLTDKWYAEHPRAVAKTTKNTKPKVVVTVEEPKGPSRVVEEAGDKSGW